MITGQIQQAVPQQIKKILQRRESTNDYIYHAKHVLEKTQTEAFIQFSALHPQVKVKIQKFESLKPFFVKQAKERGRQSCLCRKHVETQIVFSACVKFRKAAMKNSAEGELTIQVQATLSEEVDSTLCPKPEGASFQNIKRLQRECDQCGVDLFTLLPEESADEGSVRWSQYDYIPTGKEERKEENRPHPEGNSSIRVGHESRDLESTRLN